MNPPKAYTGNEPYIFISYSHRDIGPVWELIEALNVRGFRVWYDDGISAGTEFDDIIAAKVEGCEALVSYNTDNLFASRYCKQELLYAAKLGKKIINVICSSNAPGWYEMRFATTYQQVFGDRLPNAAALADVLSDAELLRACRSGKEKKESSSAVTKPIKEGSEKDPGEVKDGRDLDGERKDDRKNGHNVFFYPDGSRYDGEWKDDKRNGHGVYYDADGGRYEGEWKDDEKNGHGVTYRPDGTKEYDGEWKEGKKNGHGVTYYSDGTKDYDGEWKEGKKNGRGVLYLFGKPFYDGEWKDGKRNGHGIEYRSDGTKMYDGEWKDGERHGEGIEYDARGKRTHGIWENGILIRKFLF